MAFGESNEWLHMNRRGPFGRYQSRDRFLENSSATARVVGERHAKSEMFPTADSVKMVTQANSMVRKG